MTRVEIDGLTVQGLSVLSDPQCPHRMAYTTDFERDQADGQIDICIAVLPS